MLTYEGFFKAVAEVLKEEGCVYFGPEGTRYPVATDLMKFKDWGKLANKLGLIKPKHIICETCNQIIE